MAVFGGGSVGQEWADQDSGHFSHPALQLSQPLFDRGFSFPSCGFTFSDGSSSHGLELAIGLFPGRL